MGENHFARVPTAIYGAVLLMAAIAYFILAHAIIRKEGQDSILGRAFGSDWKGKISPLLYLIAIGLAFVHEWLAQAVYTTVAIMPHLRS